MFCPDFLGGKCHPPPPYLIYKPPPSFGIIALHGLMDFTPKFQEPTIEFKAYQTIHVNVGGGGSKLWQNKCCRLRESFYQAVRNKHQRRKRIEQEGGGKRKNQEAPVT